MRVSERLIFNLASEQLGKTRADELTAVDQVSSGIKVRHPWDGAAEAGTIAREALEKQRQDSIKQTVQTASGELQAVDDTLGQVVNALSRAHELAVQLSNDTYSAANRAASATEVTQLLGQVVNLANTRQGSRYVFGGMKDAAPPFDATGAYLGDANVRQVEVAPGVYQPASLRADQVFKGVGGGVDVMTELQNFATALSTNNAAGIRAATSTLDNALQQVSTAQSKVGGMYDVMDTAANAAQLNADSSFKVRQGVEEVDFVEATTRYAATQRSLEAAMSAVAKQFKLTLLDKL